MGLSKILHYLKPLHERKGTSVVAQGSKPADADADSISKAREPIPFGYTAKGPSVYNVDVHAQGGKVTAFGGGAFLG